MSDFDRSPKRPDVTDVNEEAQKDLLGSSAELYRHVTKLVHGVFSRFLSVDRMTWQKIENDEVSVGEQIDLYILDDMLTVPRGVTFPRSLTLKLRDEHGEPELGADELVISIPIEEDFDFDNEVLGQVSKVYIEHKKVDKEPVRFVLDEFGYRPYSALADGEEVVDIDLEQVVFPRKRIESGLPALAQLNENLINMDVVPQRRIIAGTDEAIDL